MTDSNPKNERQRGNKIVQQFGQLSTAEESADGVNTLFTDFLFCLILSLVFVWSLFCISGLCGSG